MSNWISVKDRLPKVEVQVLLYAIGYRYDGFRYRYLITGKISVLDEKHFIGTNTGCCIEATHWQPPPEPPKEDQ